MRSCKNHGGIGGVCRNIAGVRAARSRGSRCLFSGAVECGSGVSAAPGDVRVGAAGDVGGERQGLRDDNGQRGRRRALRRNGNNHHVANAAATAAAGQS